VTDQELGSRSRVAALRLLIERPFLSLRVHYLGPSRPARFDRLPGNATSYGRPSDGQ
jgi:hypothetical protein